MKKINVTDFKKLDVAFRVGNGKCSERLAYRGDVEASVRFIENKFIEKGIPKCARTGVKFSIQPGAEELPNEYYKERIPEATQFEIERRWNGWFVVEIRRANLRSNQFILLSNPVEGPEGAVINHATKFEDIHEALKKKEKEMEERY